MADNPVEKSEEPVNEGETGAESARVEKKDDFRYIVRIATTDLDGKRKIQYALTGIKGIGNRVAKVVCTRAEVDPTLVLGYMKPQEIERIEKAVDSLNENLPVWMINRRKDYYSNENRHLLGTELLIS